MNWEAIGAIGEILSAITVIASIFYLSIQIRQNTRGQSIAIFESAMSGFNEVNRFFWGDLERASITQLANGRPAALPEFEVQIYRP